MWALWVVGGLVVWAAVAGLVGVVLGRGIRLADRRAAEEHTLVLPTGEPVAPVRASARTRRRALPLPPLGVALAAVAVALETTGYALRLSGTESAARELLSMDAPLSLPRMFVAALFAGGAAAAIVGAATLPGRRSWWTAVGVVSGLIAAVKAGGTIHASAMSALSRTVGSAGANALSVALAAAVIGGLWWLSRTERRDRRRVLGTLALYAVAAVVLSGISSLVGSQTGSFALTAAATYVEESGEALAGVGFLMAVVVGVAPRLVLPADWALRRRGDAFTLDASDGVPGISRFDER